MANTQRILDSGKVFTLSELGKIRKFTADDHKQKETDIPLKGIKTILKSKFCHTYMKIK